MAYSIERTDEGKFCVYDNDTGKKVGEHDLRNKAVQQIRDLQREGGKAKKSDDDKSDKKKKKDDEKRDPDEHDYED